MTRDELEQQQMALAVKESIASAKKDVVPSGPGAEGGLADVMEERKPRPQGR